MRVVLHFGMHKTGSTSVQRTLSRKQGDDFLYLPWNIFSHSNLFRLLFERDKSTPLREKVRGVEIDNREEDRKLWSERVQKSITEYKGDGPIVLSAERGSAAPKFALSACRDFFLEAGATSFDVIHYLRLPQSFCASNFQQSLRDGGSELNPNSLWPRYKKRVRKLDLVFGKENVKLPLFIPELLEDRNVVSDFCKRAGIPLKKDEIVSANESMSGEAQALLFVQRHFGTGQSRGSNDAVRENNQLIDILQTIGESRLVLSKSLMGPLIERNIDDLGWISERIGGEFPEESVKEGISIGSHEDLVNHAMRIASELAQSGNPHFAGKTFDTPADLARHLDTFKTLA